MSNARINSVLALLNQRKIYEGSLNLSLSTSLCRATQYLDQSDLTSQMILDAYIAQALTFTSFIRCKSNPRIVCTVLHPGSLFSNL